MEGEKFQKLVASRDKYEKELRVYQELIDEAVDRKDRRVKVERLIKDCQTAFQAAFERNEDVIKLAEDTGRSESFLAGLHKWAQTLIVENDVHVEVGRTYVNSEFKPDDSSSKASKRTIAKSSKRSQSKTGCSSCVSKTSSQRRLEQKLARMRREEIERQNEAEIRIAQQRIEQNEAERHMAQLRAEHEAEQARQTAERGANLAKQKAEHDAILAQRRADLEMALLEEQNRKRLAQAKLDEVALEDSDSSDGEQDLGELPEDEADGKKAHTQNWLDSTSTNVLQMFDETPAAERKDPPTTEGQLETSRGPTTQPVLHTAGASVSAATEHRPKALSSEETIPNSGKVGTNQQPPHGLPTTTIVVSERSKPLERGGANQTSTVSSRQLAVGSPQPPCNPNIPANTGLRTQPPSNRHVPSKHARQSHFTYEVGGTTYYQPPPTTLPNSPRNQRYSAGHDTSFVPDTSMAPVRDRTSVCDRDFEPCTNPALTMKDLAELLTVSRKDPLPEWKLSSFDGNPLQWHEWYGQFKSAVDQASITEEVKMTYLKTLVTGRAKSTIEGFAYSGALYRDALKALERKFGQPQAVVSAHLEKLNNYPPVKMHNSESIINYACAISSFIAVFTSLGYEADLNSSSLLNQVVQKLPPNLRESWSLHTVKKGWLRPSLLNFNDWLQEKAEAHDRMHFGAATKPKPEVTPTTSKVKTATKTFASDTQSTSATGLEPCVVCKGKHWIARCSVFREKTPTQRAKFVADNKLCFACLGKGHTYRKCTRSRQCSHDGCQMTHHGLLHGAPRVFPPRNEDQSTKPHQSRTVEPPPQANKKTNATAHHGSSNRQPNTVSVKGLLPIAEVEVLSPTTSINTMVLCDSGASHSWISEDLAQRLCLEGQRTSVTVNGINCQEVFETKTVELQFRSCHAEAEETFAVTAFTRFSINVGRELLDVDALKTQYPHLDPIPNHIIDYSKVELILGQDAYDAIRPLEYYVSRDKTSPVAVRLPIGWVLSGPLPATAVLSATCFEAEVEANAEISQQLKRWYDMETFGAVKNVDPASSEEARAKKILNSSTFHDGQRYVVGMLWKDEDATLPNNYYSSLAQLKSLERRLSKDTELQNRYAQTIKDDLEKGYVKVVDPAVRSKREWYLPHHPVINPNKPGKARRVLNGAATFQKQSLNSSLLTGPDLLQNLLSIILKFRQHAYAVSADIEGMFLQVGVPEPDQASLRFLWREDPTSKVVVHQYTRHIFGAKDSPTCANYALQRTADDNGEEFPEAARSVKEHFYMDDYLQSFESDESAVERCKNLVELLKRGGFNLTKFVANFDLPKCLSGVSAKESSEKTGTTELSSHVLGLRWDQKCDTLVVSRGINREVTGPITQRLVLSCVASIFDPIGLVAPYTVKARLLLKEIWRVHGQKWDEPLPEKLAEQFTEWSVSLPVVGNICLPRCYFQKPVDHVELHIFGDSSKDVFGAVAFLRARCVANGEPLLAFVIGKSRVAPMKALTIPKLELQAALLAARLKLHVEAALSLKIEKVFMWSDSSTVIQWLHSSEKQPVFVANRLAEILEATTVDQWYHVSSANNPADVVTRGLPIEELKESAWIKGPSFLLSKDWPFEPPTQRVPVKSPKAKEDLFEIDSTAMSGEAKPPTRPINWQRYSSYPKLVRIVAYIMRLHPNSNNRRQGPLVLPDEFRKSECKLFCLAQEESFGKEVKLLTKEQCIPTSSPIASFAPFVGHDDLLRATGRLMRLVSVPFETKHPVLLDGRHPLVRLYLTHVHQQNAHQGVEFLRALVQQTFAILKLRTTLRSIASKCVTCRKFRANPPTPLMADLPKERVAYRERPFTNTGMDYFGPLYVSVKRSTEKRWGFLFTCMTTRAVHIEVVPSLDTSSCVMGLERFTARRGLPQTIWSDNGTNFVGAERELSESFALLNQERVAQAAACKGVTWKFNPPMAPHHGGVWERLVQSCKRLFYRILGQRRLTDEVLQTTFCLVEQFLNARPLTAASADPVDLDALTPNHFLIGGPNVSSAFHIPEKANPEDHRQRYRKAIAYADAIWTRWLQEYVPTLNCRSKWNKSSPITLKTGDLVWLAELTNPRGFYPLARVVELHFGSDGIARSAVIRSSSGVYTRPVTKLVPVFDPSFPSREDVAHAN